MMNFSVYCTGASQAQLANLNQIATKRAKLEQLGSNVFGLAASSDLAERTIVEIENFYRSVQLPTELTEHGDDKAAAIDTIIKQLETHGMVALGENQAITLEVSRQILEDAVK